MRALSRSDSAQPGPGMSRWAFRLRRMWKKAWVRRIVLVVLPLGAVVLLGLRLVSDPVVHARLSAKADQAIALLSMRPEFAVQRIDVSGASEEVAREIREIADMRPGMSSLNLDVAQLKAWFEQVGAVRTADVALRPDGVLQVDVVERVPAALWRDDDRRLWLVDREGAQIARAMTRLGYPELPVMLGDGATDAVSEGLQLLSVSHELEGRVRALVRVGSRRWDLVLDRDLRVMLPEADPGKAIAHVIAWHYGEEVLDRDLAIIDMRLPTRPTLRMQDEALELYRLRKAADGKGEDT